MWCATDQLWGLRFASPRVAVAGAAIQAAARAKRKRKHGRRSIENHGESPNIREIGPEYFADMYRQLSKAIMGSGRQY